MDYKGYLIMKVEGWYEVDGLVGTYPDVDTAKEAIDDIRTRVYIVFYDDVWGYGREMVGIYSSQDVAEMKVSKRVEEQFLKHTGEKHKETQRERYTKAHEIEEVEIDV